MKDPLVSVIVPTKDSYEFLDECLLSVQNQTYKNIELIVIDNYSTDRTRDVAAKYTKNVWTQGDEHSAQRNFEVKQAKGKYVILVDSDMVLTPGVVESCLKKVSSDQEVIGIIIPEESFGVGLWAECKRLERSFYIGVDAIEAARFFTRSQFLAVGGYDSNLVSGEDWELSSRIRAQGKIVSIQDLILHNEGTLSLRRTLQKKYYYAKNSRSYLSKSGTSSKMFDPAGPVARYRLFFSRPGKLFKNPMLGLAMLAMKTAEYIVGGVGYLTVRRG